MRVLRTALPAVLAVGTLSAVLPTAATAAPPTTTATPAAAAKVKPVSVQTAVAAATTGIVRKPAMVRSGPGQAFVRRTGTVRAADGSTHVRYDRTYRGLSVLGGDVVVHVDAKGTVTGASASLATTLKLSVEPGVSKARAAAVARASFKATKATARSTSQSLVVYAVGTPVLAWESVTRGVRADGTPTRYHVVVNARTGKVLEAYDDVQTGTGHGFHNGTVTIGTRQNGSTYEMRDPSRGGNYTVDVNNGTDPSSGYLAGTVFTSANDVFGDGTLSNRATSGVDAHYGAQVTWDYFKNVHARNGIKNDGVAARSRVHYDSNYPNAFWDDDCFCMTYGDGDSEFNPLTTLDVAGHEMAHGITSNTAGLVYSGESGGLNEATSDIFGTMVEFYANNSKDPGDFLIGEKVMKDGTSLRYMDKPSRDGSSLDCYTRFAGWYDVHYSSGIANHFFFLLSNGSGTSTYGTSPTCNSSTVTGIGRDKAAKIWYKALTTYFTSRTNYSGARTGTLKAASDLYGSTSTEYNAVKAAWSAVSVTR